MQQFHCKTKIVSGENALDWLEGLECSSLLLVADPYFAENGWAELIGQ